MGLILVLDSVLESGTSSISSPLGAVDVDKEVRDRALRSSANLLVSTSKRGEVTQLPHTN